MKKILIATAMSLFLTGVANAGFGLGFSGSLASVDAIGTETDKTATTDGSLREATAGNTAIVPSVFLEYTFGDDAFTIGYDYVIGEADVNQKRLTRTDDSSESAQDGDRTAQANIDNVMSVYAELPLHMGLYAKAGYIQMDVNTEEKFSGSTAQGTYGNKSVNGVLWGFGYKNALGTSAFYKVEGTHTQFDTVNFASTTTDKGTNISADLDVTKATFAVGFSF